MKKLLKRIAPAVEDFSGLPLGTYAASAAFFMFVSTLPFLLMVSMLVPKIGIGADQMISTVTELTPDYVDDLLEQIIRDTFSRSTGVVPIYVVMILWSAAMSMSALGDGLRLAYHVEKRQNFIVTKLLSILYIVILLLLLLGAMLFMVFGKILLEFTGINRIQLPDFLSFLLHGRLPFYFLISLPPLLLLYTAHSTEKKHPLRHLPGSIFTLVGWMIFSSIFSIYLRYNKTYGILYGSMSVMVVLLLWIFISVFILLTGAWLNSFIQRIRDAGGYEEGN